MRRSFMALTLVAGLLVACGGQAISAEPSSTPVMSGELAITTPADGIVSDTKIVTITGTAPDGAEVVRDISFAPDDQVIATGGTWSMSVDLDEGDNELVFRIGDDKSTAQTITVTYRPAAVATPEPTAELTAMPAPTPVLTVAATPTTALTPTPAPLAVLKPADGATVNTATVTFAGTAPAGARVLRDIPLRPDTTTNAGADGKWSMQVDLSEGRNDLTFRVGDDPATEVKVAVTYVKQAPVAKIGKAVVIDGIEVTVLKVQSSTGSTYWKPPKGYIWVGYRIRMRASDQSRFVSSSDWVALADGTKQGDWTITGDDDWQPLLSLTELRAGASTTGWIAFEMPKPKKYIRLIYDPSFFSDEAKLTFDVKFP